MKQNKYIFLSLMALVIIIAGFSSLITKSFVKYAGQKVTAIVTEVPVECDRYNSVKILLGGKQYEVNIGRTDCEQHIYLIGKSVQIIQYKNCDELVWPSSQPEFVIMIVVFIFLYVLFSIRKTINRKTKDIVKN